MAGQWNTVTLLGTSGNISGIADSFVADATTGNIPVLNGAVDSGLIAFSGVITDVRVLFGSPAPNSLTITVQDALGIQIAQGTLTATGRLSLITPVQAAGGLSVVLTGNTVASATGTIEILAI